MKCSSMSISNPLYNKILLHRLIVIRLRLRNDSTIASGVHSPRGRLFLKILRIKDFGKMTCANGMYFKYVALSVK
jgi:hypothetical protein